jgi:4-methyl-5(b-hydroxyethyl)-thiazole monophosphate biosynthesis
MKLLMVVSKDNEDVETLATRALLIRAGIEVDMGTFEDSLDIKAAYGTQFKADLFIENSPLESYMGLIIPGGKYVALTVDEDTKIKTLARTFLNQKKYLFAICAGPRFLLQEGLIDGDFTAFPGSEVDQKKGTYLNTLKVVTDEWLITARSVGAVYDFVFAIIDKLQGKEALEAFKKGILY